MANQYKKDYGRAKAIYDSLTDQEKHWVSPRNEFVDSDKILFREVMQNGKGQDVGFIDVYEFNKNKQVGFIVMAIHPDFRSQGYSRKLRTSAIENCKKLRMSKLIYRCDAENVDSLRSIKRDKRFTLITKGKTYYSFGIDLDKYEEDVPDDSGQDEKAVQEAFMMNEEGRESDMSILLSFCDSHNVNLYDSYVVFAEENKPDKDGWYTDKYGNRKLKGDSYYVGMDTHADEEAWKQKIVFKSFDKKVDQYSHGKPQPNIIIDGKVYRARSEVIVMDGNKVLIDKTKNRAGFGYTFPGGGIDPGESFAQNARRECEEEALIIPKRIHYMNIAWFMNYTNGIMNDGAISFVCVAEKGNNFKGRVNAHDKDEFADNAVWMDYRRIGNLAPPHKVAIERFLHGQEFAEAVSEGYIQEVTCVPLVFSNENEFFGLEEFKEKKLNTCFVTGMSGGGKSTFAKQLSKEAKADVITLDNLEYRDKWQWKDKECSRSLYWIFKWCDANGYTEKDDEEYVHRGHTKFLRWLRTQESPKNRFIVEGVQIPWMFHIDESLFDNAAWALINTSVATSVMRRYKRDKETPYGFRIDNLPKMTRQYLDWYWTQNKLRADLSRYFDETTGPAASGPVVGMEKDLVFVSQYGPKNSKAKIVEGYAVSNDMMTKNIIVTDCESGTLKKVPFSYLEGREITMFELRSEGGLGNIVSEVGKPHTKNFIYEALTGKELLSDDQLFCEEGFTLINPIEMGAEVVSEIQSMFSTYKPSPEFELMSEKYIQEADKLLEGIDDVVVLENQHGFFAKNTKTGKRTGYFKHIKDIPVKVVKKI